MNNDSRVRHDLAKNMDILSSYVNKWTAFKKKKYIFRKVISAPTFVA